jgi:tetratricopeptide (TPR) repeat protein
MSRRDKAKMLSNQRTRTGLILLAIVLPVLAGCVSGPKTLPDKNPVTVTGPTVERLEEGRQGFIINEPAVADEQARREFERAIVLINDAQYDQAIELLEKVVERAPGITAPHINLAIAYRQVNKPGQAEAHLKTALSLIPDHPVAGNEYGLLCRKAGRFDEAREIYEKVIVRFPDYYPVRRNLGILCDLYLSDLACALEQYEIYSEGMPEDRQVTFWIADLRNRLGQ